MVSLDSPNRGKTAVRYGDKDGWVDFLKARGFSPQVTEVTQSAINNLSKDDRYYGFLLPDSQILLIDTIETKDKKKTTRYWLIVI
jgi:hypothetical protein